MPVTMKDSVIEILDDTLEAYGPGNMDLCGVAEKSIQYAAESITQLMCDAAVHQMWYFGRWPEAFMLISNRENAFLREQGFTDDQIKAALSNPNNLKERI